MIDTFGDVRKELNGVLKETFKDGVPCNHPCENCGRISGKEQIKENVIMNILGDEIPLRIKVFPEINIDTEF